MIGLDIYFGALLVLFATSAGSATIFLLGCMDGRRNAIMLAFAAGAMAYSSLELLSEALETGGTFWMLGGLAAGIGVLAVMERSLPHVHRHVTKKDMQHSDRKAIMIGGAIAIHNIPEGLAVATAFASSTPLGWFVATTIAIQDVPEGMLIAAPLACYGMSKGKAALFGVLSGAAEAAGAVLGFLFLSFFAPLIPGGLAFSAGAMSYVVLVELVPDAFRKGMEREGALAFAAGAALAFGIAALVLG